MILLLVVTSIGFCWGSTKITVYQSTLTYYDTVLGEGEWAYLTNEAKELNFTTRFECQFLTLPFEFPYYSDMINRIGVTKLGFVYTGPFSNARLTELMHIAPLMNLYTLEGGTVKYETLVEDKGNSFYVLEWADLTLLNYSTTFQLQLYQNGSIVFVYQNVSEGLLDWSLVSIVSAFPWVTPANQASKDLVYYEYEEVNVDTKNIKNGTAITFNLRQNCLAATNCTTCLDIGKSTQFSCMWCDALQRCSDTFDSKYAQWEEECSQPTTQYTECPANQDRNETLTSLSDELFEQQLALLNEWFESLATSLFQSSSTTCNEGLFYSPYTLSCNDCIYCAAEDCQDQCSNATQDNISNESNPRKNMKVKNFKFRNINPDTSDFWKSAFVGMTCGVAVSVCFGFLLVCMKRRNYVQPGGVTWDPRTTPASMSQLDEKPLIYGSSVEGYNA